MSGTYVTDITHYLDDEGELPLELPSPARKLASFLVLVIDAVTQDIPGQDYDTRIRCRVDGCTGSIRASMNDEISWSCRPQRSHHELARHKVESTACVKDFSLLTSARRQSVTCSCIFAFQLQPYTRWS